MSPGSPTRRITTVIIGAGQAGLASSRCLDERGVDHVLLERGAIANTWRTERWNSLRLLTPNYQCKLPGYDYRGNDPDGFMGRDELVEFLDHYARHINAPVHTDTRVTELTTEGNGYRVTTNRDSWLCQTVIIASGAYNTPVLPKCAAGLPSTLYNVHAHQYQEPGQLPEGGVLVVGGSATGAQLAREIQQSGRQVILSTGEHVRMPRRYRGADIMTWMDRAGVLDESYDDVDDIRRARKLPSAQLQGSDKGEANLDLNSLRDQGVKLVGRLAGIQGQSLQFSGSLDNVCKLADLKMNRLLRLIDDWITAAGLDDAVPAAEVFADTLVDKEPPLALELTSGEVSSVVWACGFRPDYSWLKVPILDRKGLIRHDGGVTEAPGLYAMGLPFLRRRKSNFLYGAGDDARDVTAHLAGYLKASTPAKCFAVA